MSNLSDPTLHDDWHAVARISDVPEGRPIGAMLLGEPIVLWKSNEGVQVWRDLCAHRGTRLSLGRVENDCLACPYHGWEYNSSGACVRIPAQADAVIPSRARVETLRSVQHLDWIWASFGSPEAGPPEYPEWNDSTYRHVSCGPYRFNAYGTRAIENFLDVAHFPFVHEGTLGVRERAEVGEYDVQRTESGIISDPIRFWQPDPDGSGQGREVEYVYEVLRPLTARLVKRFEPFAFAIFFTIAPAVDQTCTGWMLLSFNYEIAQTDEQIRRFQDAIFAQDVPIIESQRPEKLPLDLSAELHLRSDRLSIGYRQWLREIGFGYGTP